MQHMIVGQWLEEWNERKHKSLCAGPQSRNPKTDGWAPRNTSSIHDDGKLQETQPFHVTHSKDCPITDCLQNHAQSKLAFQCFACLYNMVAMPSAKHKGQWKVRLTHHPDPSEICLHVQTGQFPSMQLLHYRISACKAIRGRAIWKRAIICHLVTR